MTFSKGWKRFKELVLEPSPEPFWGQVFQWKFLIGFLTVVLIVLGASQLWVFEYAGLFAKDSMMKWRPPRTATHCELVEITEQDRDGLFLGDEPLSAAGLTKIIGKILEQQPQVIAVDIDTSSAKYRAIPKELANDRRIVWGRAGAVEEAQGRTVIRALAILGQRPDQEPPFSGLAFFPASQDWTVRSYWRCIDVSGGGRLPSFVAAILQAQAGYKSAVCEPGEIEVRALHDVYEFHPPISLQELSRYAPGQMFQGKIVLLGGSYAYHDRHSTPFGVINGVELVATAVETEIDHKNEHTEREWVHLTKKWSLKILLSLLVVLIHVRLRPVAAMIGTVGLLSCLVFFGMTIAFVIADYSPDFVPFLVGIWMEQLIEGSIRAEEKERHFEKVKVSAPAGVTAP
jgi:CHASE2 domain-containing sensor protein